MYIRGEAVISVCITRKRNFSGVFHLSVGGRDRFLNRACRCWVPSYATLDAPVRTLAFADEELILQVLFVIFHLMQHFGCTSECAHMRT